MIDPPPLAWAERGGGGEGRVPTNDRRKEGEGTRKGGRMGVVAIALPGVICKHVYVGLYLFVERLGVPEHEYSRELIRWLYSRYTNTQGNWLVTRIPKGIE